MRKDILNFLNTVINWVKMVISTNGTLIDKKNERIKELGISYVGISLDGKGCQ